MHLMGKSSVAIGHFQTDLESICAVRQQLKL